MRTTEEDRMTEAPVEATDESTSGDAADDFGMAFHVIAPIAALAGTWAARKALDSGYHKLTGHHPPRAVDPGVNLRKAVLWAALTAATAAITEVLIYRAVAHSRAGQTD
jgi:hypothetical protein